jgi:adenylyltransferase/sulfurtransferase
MSQPVFAPGEMQRYQRHVILPGVGETGQAQLKQSSVLVVGAGGLGSAAALYLAAAGVGCLGLADADTVDESNLQRQVIHDTRQLGRLKVESAAERIHALNPWVQVDCHAVHLEQANAAHLIQGYEIILDATDNFTARDVINRACTALRKPMVYGAVYQFEGQVSIFAPHLGAPCYRCVFKELPPDPTEPVGIFGALPGVVGSLQALEVLKLITGVGQPLLGKLLLVDTLENRYQCIHIPQDPGCPVCGTGTASV